MYLMKCLIVIISVFCVTCKVLELGSEFEDTNDLKLPHLVMFYAPWCGHCKSLQPIWYELGNKLNKQTVAIARIDSTIYRTAAEKFNVRGFPSIRLIGKDRMLEFVGERTLEALSDFALKGSRPLLQSIRSVGKLSDLRRSDDVLYLALNISDELRQCLMLLAPTIVHETILAEVKNDEILEVVNDVKTMEINGMTQLRADLSISRSPGIIVLKDSKVYEYSGNMDDCFDITEWIRSERFSSFQKGSYPVIHPLIFIKYKIVFYFGESKSRIFEMEYISTQRETLPGNFYFIHIDKAEYIETLISAFVEADSILVFDPVTELYSYSTDAIKSIKTMLEEVVDGKADLYGGTSLFANAKKVWYRIVSNVWPLFVDHPFIMGLIILIPTALIVFCCWDDYGSRDAEPEKQVRCSESQMDILWKNDTENNVKITSDEDKNDSCPENVSKDMAEEELLEEKDPDEDKNDSCPENVSKDMAEEELLEEKDPELKKDE